MNNMKSELGLVRLALEGVRFDLHNEKVLQSQVADRLTAEGLDFAREVRLSPAHIIDFMVGSVGVEIKIRRPGNSAKAVYMQCLAYCGHHQVQALLLLTNYMLGLPPDLSGKPTQKLNLGLAWL